MAPVNLRPNHIKTEYNSRSILAPFTTDFINYSLKNVESSNKTIEGLCLTIQYLTRQLDECSKKKPQNSVDFGVKLRKHRGFPGELKARTNSIADLEDHLQGEQREFKIQLESTQIKFRKDHENLINQLNNSKNSQDSIQPEEEQESQVKNPLNKLVGTKKDSEHFESCIKPILIMKDQLINQLKTEVAELKKRVQENSSLQKKNQQLEAQLKTMKASKNHNNNFPDIDMISNEKFETLDAEIWSLRSVLDLQNKKTVEMRNEIDVLRRDIEEKDEEKKLLKQRVEYLEARCEDLNVQLQNKKSSEHRISQQNEQLLGSCHNVSRHNEILIQKNEELQWKLRQNNKVVNVLASHLTPPPPRLAKSLGAEQIDQSLASDKLPLSRSNTEMKYMVRKNNSVSWTLDIDDSCDLISNNENIRPSSRHRSPRKSPRKSLNDRVWSKSPVTPDDVARDWSPGYNSTPLTSRKRLRSSFSKKALYADKLTKG